MGRWEVSESGSDAEEATSKDQTTAKRGDRNRSRSRSRSSSNLSSMERGRVDRKVGPGGVLVALAAPLPKPPLLPGCEWWQAPLLEALEGVRSSLPAEPWRPMYCESLYAGMVTEIYADRALGIQSHFMAVSEKKPAGQKFITRNHSGHIDHIYHHVEDMVSPDRSKAKCLKCVGVHCSSDRLQNEVDCVRAGLPCQPFSRLRTKNRGGDEGPVRQHSQWGAAGLFFEYVTQVKPGGFICEEVLAFGDTDPETGKPYVVLFQEKAVSMGYATRVFELQASDWGPFSRPRLYIVGLSERLGHARAAQWMASTVDSIVQHRRMGVASPLFSTGETFGVLDRDEDASSRRKHAKASRPHPTLSGCTSARSHRTSGHDFFRAFSDLFPIFFRSFSDSPSSTVPHGRKPLGAHTLNSY